MGELLFTILYFDEGILEMESRIYEPGVMPRLEILHGAVRRSHAWASGEKLENVSQIAKERPQQKQRRKNHQRKQKEKVA